MDVLSTICNVLTTPTGVNHSALENDAQLYAQLCGCGMFGYCAAEPLCVLPGALWRERERDEQERKTLRITAHEKPDHRLLLLSKSRNVTMMTGSYLKLCCY